ncbi:MAG: hypothetical protein ABIP77_06420 [Candidatus Limnocylindrales bacterium]
MRHRPRAFIALAAVLLAVGACGSTDAPAFDPTGPCTADGAAPGAYPDLESRVPTTYEGQSPVRLDSGRNCSTLNLGVLADAGITEVRFAGGNWSFGGNRAAALVVFAAPGLTADLIADFFANSARAASNTKISAESTADLAGESVRRLDSTTGSRIQSVVVWEAADPDVVNVVITNDLPDPKIESAVAAFGGA